MRAKTAYTLVELLVVVLMVGVLTFVAVPRLQWGLTRRQAVDTTAWKLVAALGRARSLAILYAATKPAGFALKIQGTAGSQSFQIVDLAGSSVVDSEAVDSQITCTVGCTFTFTPLGALKPDSDRSLTVTGTGRTFTVTVVPATGMVQCVES